MYKKLILTRTLTYVGVIGFVIIFKTIFGDANTLIGVTTVMAALMLLERDLTTSISRNTLKLIAINIGMGFSSYLVVSNIYLGIFINFLTLFFISYQFSSDIRNSVYMPFSLQYLFLLSTPVSSGDFLTRIISLIFSAFVIMFAQIVVNRNKLSKSGNKLLSDVCNIILSKMKSNNNSTPSDIDDVNQIIDSFRTIIYDKREHNYYLTEEGRLKLNLSVSLENLNSMIHDAKIQDIDNDIFDSLDFLIKETMLILDDELDYRCIDDISSRIEELFKVCDSKNISDLFNLQLLDSMLLLADTITSLKLLENNHSNIVKKSNKSIKFLSNKSFRSYFIDRKSLRFCYAIRVAICVTIATFIVQYFEIPEGRWILFTLISIITPLYESSKSKTKDRIFATIIGSFVIFILFSLFEDSNTRMLIILLAGYLNGYTKEYKYSTIFVTISAIGSAALIGDIKVLAVNRLLFVFIAVLVALFANKYIFPYKLKDSIIQLKIMYEETIIKMLKEVENLIAGNKRPDKMKNLLILTSLIDSKARSNEQIANSTFYSTMITERRFLVANIYEMYIWILYGKIKCNYQKEILNDLKDLINYSDEDVNTKITQVEHEISITKDIGSKIIFSSIIVILKELHHLCELDKAI